MRPNNVLMIMVDGLGLPPVRLSQTIYSSCRTLTRLFRNHTIPLDATLGVAGIPQSATGQTAILTGVNAARLMGKHVSGFPNARLREVLEQENLFKKLMARGCSCTFANAYARLMEMNLPLSLQSVTTVVSLAALGAVRDRNDLLTGKAVYHDLTRQWLREKGDTAVPIIDEATAAKQLLTISRTVDFCLFEYFLTDHVGHRGTIEDKIRILRSLDTFLNSLLNCLDRRQELLLLVSDHGNIENLDNRSHSLNPVPWTAVGKGAEFALHDIHSLPQVVPRILDLYTLTEGSGNLNS